MHKVLVAVVMLCAAAASAKAWNGIDPGVTSRDELVKHFGDPSRVVTTDGREIMAYFGPKAIKGTAQAQFRIDPVSKLVERIDVFPGPTIDKETVESTYGPPCQTKPASPPPVCYFRKLTDDFRTYLLYPKIGLAVFFNEDGKTVQSFVFQTPKSAASKGSN